MINPEDDKKFSRISAIEYLDTRQFKIDRFLNERFRRADYDYVLEQLMEDPISLANIIKYNYEMSEQQRINMVLNKISTSGSLSIMIGAKRNGKTGTLVWIYEELHKINLKKGLYWFGYSEDLNEIYPFVKQVTDFVAPDSDSFLGVDETGLFLFARDAMSKSSKEKIKKLPTLGHRDLAGMFLTQSGKIGDIDLFMLADYIWFKPYFVTELDTRLRLPKWLVYCLPHNKNENMVFDLNMRCIYTFKNNLPTKWSDRLSKPYSKIPDIKSARIYLEELEKRNIDLPTIQIMLELRGWNYEDVA